MKAKRKKLVLKEKGHMNGPVLKHMREVAYGSGMTGFINRVLNKPVRHVDEMDTITAAERKRARRLERNKRNA